MINAKQISIIGATGNLGIPVTRNLLGFGYEVTLIVRNVDKAQKIYGNTKNVEIVEADLTDIKALQIALSNTEYLYLNLSTLTTNIKAEFATEREGVANILRAINKNKIKQIIAISGLGAFDNVSSPSRFEFIPNIIRKQGHRLIKESGIPHTLLHCSWFADSFVFYRRKNIYSIIGSTENPIYFTNCYDYTIHLTNAIGNPNAFYKEFPIQGKIGYTHPEAAKKFLKLFSESTKINVLPGWLVGILSIFIEEMKFVKHMSDYSFASKEEFLAEECETFKILGQPTLDLTRYAQKVKQENAYYYLAQKQNT